MQNETDGEAHLRAAERKAAEVADAAVLPRAVNQVGIIGAGTMGGGIAMALLNVGVPAVVLETSGDALARGEANIGGTYDASIKRGSLTEAAKAERLSRLTGTTQYDDLAGCDLIIEAAFEDMAVKQEIFGKLDRVAKPGAVLATNTSYLDINTIAAATRRPADVLGMHFFSPANVMKLVEVVRGAATAPEALATALAVSRQIAKIPVVVGVCHGFVGNRMLAARSAELEDLLLEGAAPEQVDKAFTDFGWPMGPFAMRDLAGLDVGWRNRKALGESAPIADALCEQGRFGQKTGKGYYVYEAGARKGTPDPEVTQLIRARAQGLGVAAREISAEEIIERTHYPMINEGAKILDEGIAARASDIDVVYARGYGFPSAKGGPMYWAKSIGLDRIAERLAHWHAKTGKAVFRPAPGLTSL